MAGEVWGRHLYAPWLTVAKLPLGLPHPPGTLKYSQICPVGPLWLSDERFRHHHCSELVVSLLALPRPYHLVLSDGMFLLQESVFLVQCCLHTLLPIALPRNCLSQLLAGMFPMQCRTRAGREVEVRALGGPKLRQGCLLTSIPPCFSKVCSYTQQT